MALGRDRKSSVLTPVIRAAAGALGVAVFAAGVLAVFVTENGTGAAALLAIGAAFMVIAVVGIESRASSWEESTSPSAISRGRRMRSPKTPSTAVTTNPRRACARSRVSWRPWLAATVACGAPCDPDMSARARSSM